MDPTELLQKHDQGDLLRVIAEAVLQRVMESDFDSLIARDIMSLQSIEAPGTTTARKTFACKCRKMSIGTALWTRGLER